MKLDHFNGVTDEDFVNRFKEVLFCRMELNNYTYPYELFDEDDAFMVHLEKCERILAEYMYECANEGYAAKYHSELEAAEAAEDEVKIEEIHSSRFSNEERNEIVKSKRRELTLLMNNLIEQYRNEVKINYIDIK